jgi:hypothetical protein
VKQSWRGADYFGAVLNRAARAMAAGHGGQILLAEPTASLVSGVDLVDLGPRRLRDLPTPVGAQRAFPAWAVGLALQPGSAAQKRDSAAAWRPVSFDEGAAHRLRTAGSLKITLVGGDDGALHEDVPGAGEVVDIDQAGRFGALTDDRADIVEILDAGLPGRMRGT